MLKESSSVLLDFYSARMVERNTGITAAEMQNTKDDVTTSTMTSLIPGRNPFQTYFCDKQQKPKFCTDFQTFAIKNEQIKLISFQMKTSVAYS